MSETPITTETKPTQQFEIVVKLEGLTWGDLALLLSYDGTMSKDLIEMVDHVVEGGVKKLPFLASVEPVMEAVMKALETSSNPPAPAGN